MAGCTSLILAATAGHASTVEILLEQGADIEAQSDRTKDTALSLACSGGRQEVKQHAFSETTKEDKHFCSNATYDILMVSIDLYEIFNH